MVDVGDRHDEHDPALVAALLDRELTGFDLAAAESRVATCTHCAALFADLVALSSATRALPIPARTRDFRLTPADAARIAAGPEEPVAPGSRLAGVMTDPRTAAEHAAHDTMLVASLADHSVPSSDRAAAETLVASCSECARLHADLLALRAATQAMPTPPRPRDYLLTADDAARLRPSGWRRFVAAFGTSRDAFSRPLAVGLTTLGLAGLLVATVPSILPTGGSTAAGAPTLDTVGGAAAGSGSSQEVGNGGGYLAPVPAASAAASPVDTSVKGAGPVAAPALPAASAAAATSAPAPAATPQPAYGVARPAPTSPPPLADGAGVGAAPPASPGAEALNSQTAGRHPGVEVGSQGGPTPLVTLSGVLLIVGLGLFAIRWGARRFGGV